MKNVFSKLLTVQSLLKVKKSQFNKFGKFNYRSAEDILTAAKPILISKNCVLTVSATPIEVGNYVFIKSIASFFDIESGESYSVEAAARLDDTKKGMDSAQITGAASSYAKKYALENLFNLDVGNDNDSDSYSTEGSKVSNVKTVTDDIFEKAMDVHGAAAKKNAESKGYQLTDTQIERFNSRFGNEV